MDEKMKEPQSLNAIVGLDKYVPKFCTNIQASLTNNKTLILTMMYADDKLNASIIERVAIDLDHAAKLAKILEEAVKQAGTDNDAGD